MTYCYKKMEDGTMLPYPADTQTPKDSYVTRETILHFDEKLVLFRMPYIEGTEKSTFAIFRGSQHQQKYTYNLCRWDNTGGWKTIYSEQYIDTNEAIAYLIPMAKYFV